MLADGDKYFDRIRRGSEGIEEEVYLNLTFPLFFVLSKRSDPRGKTSPPRGSSDNLSRIRLGNWFMDFYCFDILQNKFHNHDKLTHWHTLSGPGVC